MNNLPKLLEKKLELASRAGESEEWPIPVEKQLLRMLLIEIQTYRSAKTDNNVSGWIINRLHDAYDISNIVEVEHALSKSNSDGPATE